MFHREMPVKRSSDGNDKKREEKREGGEAKCNYEAGIEWINGIMIENSRFRTSSFDSFSKL